MDKVTVHLLTPSEYVLARESYSYSDEECPFEIVPVPGLNCSGSYQGIFAKTVPEVWRNGINLRRFEEIIQEVFLNTHEANCQGRLTAFHKTNLREVTKAIVHWKNASQGRTDHIVKQLLLQKWDDVRGVRKLLEAYTTWSIKEFMIPGVAIPTASTFLRFLNPIHYGVIDSKVVQLTQANGITQMSIRGDGYINNTPKNIKKYYEEYLVFLYSEAEWLNDVGATFQDVSSLGLPYKSQFRACDVEMALWQRQ